MITKAKKIVAFAVILCMLLGLLSGCGEESTQKAYVLPEEFETISTQVLAENDDFKLEWDDELKSVMMISKKDGKTWGTMPADAYEERKMNNFVSSPIVIEAVEPSSLMLSEVRAYAGCIQNGNTSAKKIENGVEVTYYFDEYQIAVPVQYTLRDGSMAVNVNTKDIAEGDGFLLKSVSLAPFMCSLANIGSTPEEEDDMDIDIDIDIDLGIDLDIDVEDEIDVDVEDEPALATVEPEETEEPAEKIPTTELLKNGYLFVPAGNGALMTSEVKEGGDPRKFSGEVYGEDAARYQPYDYYPEESVKMPVFGVKDGENALLGIIEQGTEQGVIQASAGYERVGYSNVAATFYVRGFDVYAEKMSNVSTVNTRLSKTMVDTTFTVGFYPLTGEDADYVGMANRYREYLIGKGMTKSVNAQNVYSLSVLGNIVTASMAFGVPYNSTKSMTTFDEANTIIKEMTDETELTPSVQLLGYGQSGLDIGKVAGGFGFAGVSGSKDDYKELTEYAADNNIPLFTDFDLIYFKSNGAGYNTLMSAAKTATLHRSEVYYKMLAQRANDEDEGYYHLLNRSKLKDALDKLLGKGDKLGVSGYSFSTLGATAYSDYADAQYEMKNGMANDVQKMLDSVKENGQPVSTDYANDYAAVKSDAVFGVEVEPRYSNAFERYVPFYQIVFRGYVPMYSEAINLATDYDTVVLHALASGVGLGYNVTMNYDSGFAATSHDYIYSSLYSSNKATMIETVAKYKDYYAAIDGATIADYEVLDNGVTVTTFDNGVIAYTNNSDAAQTYPGGELAAKGFIYVQGGTN